MRSQEGQMIKHIISWLLRAAELIAQRPKIKGGSIMELLVRRCGCLGLKRPLKTCGCSGGLVWFVRTQGAIIQLTGGIR